MWPIFRGLTLVVALSVLAGCVDPAGIPSRVGKTAYQRAIDQDVAATRDTGASTARSQSLMAGAMWQ